MPLPLDILQTIHEKSWDATYGHSTQKNAIESLEGGKILFFPHLTFTLKAEELFLLSPNHSNGKSKNISFNSHKKTLSGVVGTDEVKMHLMEMMQRFCTQTTGLIQELFPTYSDHLQVARTSYRPVEIFGRKSASYKKDDTRLHVDAFPATPNQGNRILRVFSNINPRGEDRVWRVGEPFEKVAQKFLPKIKAPLVSGWLLKQLRLTKGLRTKYDHIMLQIHNSMKADLAYQKEAEQKELKLPAGSTWIVNTDVVSHAAMSGQFVLEQTFYLPVHAMANEQFSPLRILENLLRKKLSFSL